MNDINVTVQTVAVYLVPVLYAISLHEAAHGYAARYFGDPTASNEGRLSLNPIRHIDLFGTILLPLTLYWAIGVPFGYAKPVPVDFSRLRNPKGQMAWVALAGPMANLAMALGWMIAHVLLSTVSPGFAMRNFLDEVSLAGVAVNVVMFCFNLIPVPPLDGGRIVAGVLPAGLSRKYASIDRYTPFVFALLIFLSYKGYLGLALSGVLQKAVEILYALTLPLRMLLG